MHSFFDTELAKEKKFDHLFEENPFKIEKNIPLSAGYVTNKPKFPFNKMEIGDSFFILNRKDRDNASSAAHMHRERVDSGFHYALRKVDGGWRLWRVDKKDETNIKK